MTLKSMLLPSKKTRRLLVSILPALLAVGFATQAATSAFAHSRVEAGPYTIVVGWENEPAIVGERNALLIEVWEGDQPVVGLEGALEVTLSYGSETFQANLIPAAEPGTYLAEIYPTVRGEYQVHLGGQIKEQVLDLEVAADEVLSASVLQFPEPRLDTGALEERIAALQEELHGLRLLAITATTLALIALGAAVPALLKRKKP